MVTLKKRAGFTLIELLVVIAIIALLLSIVLPGLRRAKEYAKRVVCTAGLKQIGTAMQMYSDNFDGYMPDDHDVDGNRERHTYAVYRNNPGYIYPDGRLKPLRLAYLYELNYIETPEIFYCPGNNNKLIPHYCYESYTNPEPWGTLDQVFNAENGSNQWVRTGYTYYPVESRATIDAASMAPDELASKYVRLNPNIPLMTDIIHNRKSVAHQHNNKYSLNALYSDTHVSNCNDSEVFENLIGPDGSDVWDTLDAGIPDIRYYDTAIYTVFRAIGP